MPTKDELLSKRRRELLAQGYKKGIVDLAMQWAEGCAEGMASYAVDPEEKNSNKAQLVVQFLPQYLNDCEKWIRSFSHEPGEVKPQR